MLAARSSEPPAPVKVRTLPESKLAWSDIVGPAEPFLQAVKKRLASQIEAFEPDLITYAKYALTNQGKQLRPALVALSGGTVGEVDDSHELVAVIIEMVHLATLVHDDVMDEAKIRRGRPTVASAWGNELSVLLGDCLFAHSLKLAASFPTPEICRLVASATNTVCSGEILQNHCRRNFEPNRAEYFKVISMKTGELFALSCDLGALLSGAHASSRTALRQYGMALGTAYQVFDDCLDVFGSEVAAGKSLGTDLAKGKLTLPILLLLERVSEGERETIQSWIRAWDPSYLGKILELLERHRAMADAQNVVNQYLATARQKLSALPENGSRAGLQGLTDFLGEQTAALAAKNVKS